MNRRKFLQFASLATAGGFLPEMSIANSINTTNPSSNDMKQHKIVVLLHLKGANDGFSSLVHNDDADYYRKLRPAVTLPEHTLIKLNDQVAMHPQLGKLENLWKDNDMAWIEGVGYKNTILSHPRSLEVWENASPSTRGVGWLSHVLPRYKKGLHGIAIDQGIGSGTVLAGSKMNAVTMNTPQEFLKLARSLEDVQLNHRNPAIAHVSKVQHQTYEMGRQIATKLGSHPRAVAGRFTGGGVGRSLQSVAQMILSGVDAPVYKVTQTGFDTHSAQVIRQSNALYELADGLAAFATAMKHGGMWDNVVVVTYSEFGRRIKENKSAGTDHGTASAQMVFGGQVKGGLYGKRPDLSRLDGNDNVYYTTDFRAIYAELASRWWRQPTQWQKYGTLGFLA